MSNNAKIEQQIYTRERRTMFQKSEGYGTVGKSPGISEAFIKDNIHPYCVYPTSPLLQKLPNSITCPKAITVVQYQCGRMLLGQAVYVPKDFTGQRATFFAHNYILPPKVAGDILHDIEKVFSVCFMVNYDAACKGQLDTMNTLPMDCTLSKPATLKLIVKPFQLTYILQCIKESVYKDKKTYVIVPAEPVDMHEYVKKLLADIYRNLPDDVRHKLGFCTYAREPMDKKGLHLIFLEKGAVKASKLGISKDFVVDLNEPAPPHSNIADSGFTAYIRHLPPERFFPEIEFWHIRTPHRTAYLIKLENEWLDTNLDKLSLSQFTAIPEAFILRGKNTSHPELYVIYGIIKMCAIAITRCTPLDLRYFLGSYTLDADSHFRVIKNLRRCYQGHIIPSHFKNIVFLFRARGKGRLDIDGLKIYLEKFTSSLEHRDAFMLFLKEMRHDNNNRDF